ncbi:hypothetical protein AVEN_236180-1 [Araneus ventricosus]|uniref:Uncharacterized protein n=1 Tax=Araneus ventricosus TaxID=182803 RepID=A0A4Y2RYL9_ARAVE|nr:hypothetical protein AVEN_236180-1 [Araneus ventricosus]
MFMFVLPVRLENDRIVEADQWRLVGSETRRAATNIYQENKILKATLSLRGLSLPSVDISWFVRNSAVPTCTGLAMPYAGDRHFVPAKTPVA